MVYLKMHHAILGKPPQGYVVDHINGNRLDNRRCNLRFVTHQQNAFNTRKHRVENGTSRFKGVSYMKPADTVRKENRGQDGGVFYGNQQIQQ